MKRATKRSFKIFLSRSISIHALVKRATNSYLAYVFSKDISIHALVKRATEQIFRSLLYSVISIHALVKRATRFSLCRSLPKIYFNPRPREEGDFTPISTLALPFDFNPRPREEGDNCIEHKCMVARKFQSTPS